MFLLTWQVSKCFRIFHRVLKKFLNIWHCRAQQKHCCREKHILTIWKSLRKANICSCSSFNQFLQKVKRLQHNSALVTQTCKKRAYLLSQKKSTQKMPQIRIRCLKSAYSAILTNNQLCTCISVVIMIWLLQTFTD